MYAISKEFSWSASHQLDGLPDDHPCARLHGHNYVARVELEAASLDEVGFVLDYGDLAFIRRYIDDELDHRHLNDVLGFNPTAERMARMLAGKVRAHLEEETLDPSLFRVAVSVSETPKTWATWREPAR